jgi:short chain dehydrogenase
MKTIFITGGTRGIGRATALLCAREGWSVALNYVRDSAAADETAREVRAAGGHATTLRGDVTVETDVVSMFDAAQTKLGRLDGVVVNAGIVAPSLPLADMDSARLGQCLWRLSMRERECPALVERSRRPRRLGRACLISGQSIGFTVRICRLCGIKRRHRHIDHWLGQRTGAAGSPGQRRSAGAHRHRHSCQRRATRPGETSRRDHTDGPRGPS